MHCRSDQRLEPSQRKLFRSAWWTLTAPATWSGRESEGVTELVANPRLGLVQVSAARKPAENVTLEDAYSFAENSATPAEAAKPIQQGTTSGLYAEYTQSGSYWREWWLFHDRVLVFVTYTVIEELRDIERDVLDEMISSITISPSS